MSEINSHRSLKFNPNAVSFQMFVCILVFIFLAKSNEIENKNESAYQNNSESFSPNLLQKSEKVLNATRKLICYYVFTENFNPKIMDGLCTHIHVGFFRINERTHKLEVSDFQKQILSKILLLKANSSDLKVIISVGGAGCTSFSTMVLNHSTRKMFIRSCLEFSKKFGTDGIDLDWEWPVAVNGNEKEKIKFVQLLQEIRHEFSRHKKKYILSVDVPSVQAVIELGYYVKYIADFVDYVNVMCYDYHYFTKLFPFTGHNAPLYPSSDDLFSKSNANYSISFWISNSMPREKIILGMPTYGHTYEFTMITGEGHLGLLKHFKNLEIPHRALDLIPEMHSFNCYTVKMTNRLEWESEALNIPHNSSVWYRDGSIIDARPGIGIYGTRMKDAKAVGTSVSIFHAEVYAINLYSRILISRRTNGADIYIMSDTQAALKALDSWSFGSKQVKDCHDPLNALAAHNRLTFMNRHSLVAPAKGFGSIGQDGFAGYQQICQFLKNKETIIVYDALSKTPYAYRFPEWISYDDEGSLAIKVTYVLEEQLAGVMIFSVNTDDFTGSCNGDNMPLPLIKKVRNILLNEV